MQRPNASPMGMGATLGKCKLCPRSYDIHQMTKDPDGRYVCPMCAAARKANTPAPPENPWNAQRAEDV